ncbi:O-methyltransferase-domain-containing protein [Geopyxis carbonaria]|nr:O-methyltransferase-domain-containing protein [Geopyxis carbonaria]
MYEPALFTHTLHTLLHTLTTTAALLPASTHLSFAPSPALTPPTSAAHHTLISTAETLLALLNPIHGLHLFTRQDTTLAALHAALDLHLFTHVPPPPATISLTALATACHAPERTLSRLLRALIAQFIFTSPAAGIYTHTARSWYLATSAGARDLAYFSVSHLPIAAALPQHLADTGYADPQPGAPLAFNTAMNTTLPFWECIAAQPDAVARFGRAMEYTQQLNRPPLQELYPWMSIRGTVVDVGGGFAQVPRALYEHFGKDALEGVRFVVQDLPGVIAEGESRWPKDLPAIEWMPVDFLRAPQPVRGAAVYWLRHILHDWSDTDAAQILKGVIAAMGKHSRLLICDKVLPDVAQAGGGVLPNLDLLMMMCVGGVERTRSQWEALVEGAGGRIVKIWGQAEECQGGDEGDGGDGAGSGWGADVVEVVKVVEGGGKETEEDASQETVEYVVKETEEACEKGLEELSL